jgi:predicted RNA binding protein YcfA (HicA-like mRNA interferase family)
VADWRTLRDRIAANKRDTTFEDLRAMLEAAGFMMRSENPGSHRAFVKPGCFNRPTIAQRRGPLPIGYVLAALRAVDDCGDD